MPNKMERFTNHSRLVLNLSQDAAQEFGTHLIKPTHLLLAMTRAEDTDAHFILSEFDIIASKLAPFVKAKQIPSTQLENNEMPIELSKEYKKILELAVDESRKRGHYFIGSTHLLLGMIRSKSDNIIAIFHHFDIEPKELLKYAESYLADDKNFEPTISETQKQLMDRLPPPAKPITWRGIFNRIFRLNKKQKNSEK